MVNAPVTSKLLAMPVMWMGAVQLVFSVLSRVWFNDGIAMDFFAPGFFMMLAAVVINIRFKKVDLSQANFRDALIYATSTWVVAGLLGAIPIVYVTHISFTDAVFESVSALTTTGATVLSGLDLLPKSFLLYRQFLQWMGGLGIVIFVVAILPMLNVGGMKLLKAETPGPVKDDKLTPRISNTAHYLWIVYILITIACALSYYVGGMTVFDAIAHSLTTVSTGGFSTHDASMWYYQSHTLLFISDLFMLLGAINFGLHFRVVYKTSLSLNSVNSYYQDEETRIFIVIVLFFSVILALFLSSHSIFDNLLESFSFATFHVISFITSTGFGAASFADWPTFAAFVLIFTGYLGGCAGSTAGGNKIIRNIIVAKAINQYIKQLIHPRGVFTMKYQKKAIHTDVRNAVMAFMTFAAGSSLILTILVMATGLDFWSAFSAVAACVNVLGPGFGKLGSNFQPVSDSGIWILTGGMILGRLEYFTIFALFTRAFWR